jgi:hypothetical protein
MATEAKSELVDHWTQADIDEIGDLILAKASNNFLDKALSRRLHTIDGKPLINALAKAERLGYTVEDMYEEQTTEKPEVVIPALQPLPQTETLSGVPASQLQYKPATSTGQSASAEHPSCDRCGREFTTISAYQHVSGFSSGIRPISVTDTRR